MNLKLAVDAEKTLIKFSIKTNLYPSAKCQTHSFQTASFLERYLLLPTRSGRVRQRPLRGVRHQIPARSAAFHQLFPASPLQQHRSCARKYAVFQRIKCGDRDQPEDLVRFCLSPTTRMSKTGNGKGETLRWRLGLWLKEQRRAWISWNP